MYQSNYYMSLDIRDSHGTSCPEMNLGDTERKLYIHLTDGGRPYTLAPGCFPVFTAKKPDGAVIFNACQVENNMVVYRVTPQTTACAGVLQCQLRLYDGDPEKSAQLLTSARFGIRVHPTVYNEGDIPESQGEVGALTKLIGDALSAIEAAEDAAEKVENIIDDRTTTPEKTWSSKKVSGELEKLAGRRDVTASSLMIGSQLSDDVIITSEKDGGFSVLNVEKFADVPFPEQNEKRVILRNIAPGTEDDDAATVGQTKQIANSLIENTRTVVSEAEEKLREEMGEKRALHAATLRVGDTVLGDVLIQTGANEADDKGNVAGVLDFTSFAYQGNKVILRNIAPGKQENDAVTKGQMEKTVDNKKPIVVKLNITDDIASHTATQIKSFFDNGQPVFGAVYSEAEGYTGELMNLNGFSTNQVCFSSLSVFEYYVREDRYYVDKNGNLWSDFIITNNVTKEQLDKAVESLVTKEQFNGTVGDMETALDAIIAIQNELMGVEETVSFTISGSLTNNIFCTVPKGMTWREIAEAKLLSYQCDDCQTENYTITIDGEIVSYQSCSHCDAAPYELYDEANRGECIYANEYPLDGHVYRW